MHPRMIERRDAVLSKRIEDVDIEIRSVSVYISRRVRLAGALCLGEDEAEILENQFQVSVDTVIGLPAMSEEGRRARHELIAKLIELDDYLDSLLRAPWARSEILAKCRQDLDRCRQSLDRIKARDRR